MTPEQDALVSTVRAVLSKHADSSAVRAAITSEAGYDERLWAMLCEQIGAAALNVPEQHDGAGATLVESGLVLEELGASLAPSPLLGSVTAAECLAGLPGAEQVIPRIAAGEIAAIALSGPPSSPPPVELHDDRLTGTVPNVLFGDHADLLLVPAVTDDGLALCLAETSVATLTPALDPTQRLATVSFNGTPARILVEDARDAVARARLTAWAGTAALAVGCAQRGLDMTVAYVKERQQFGRPIGSFQAVKHRLADMLVLVEMSRSAARAAATAIAERRPDADRAAHTALAYCGDAVQRVAAETIQLHGGIAITWEHDAHLVFKRAHALSQLYGQPHQHRALVLG